MLSLALSACAWLLALAWSWDHLQVRLQAQASKYAPSQAQAASWVKNLFKTALWHKMLLWPICPWQCLLLYMRQFWGHAASQTSTCSKAILLAILLAIQLLEWNLSSNSWQAVCGVVGYSMLCALHWAHSPTERECKVCSRGAYYAIPDRNALVISSWCIVRKNRIYQASLRCLLQCHSCAPCKKHCTCT